MDKHVLILLKHNYIFLNTKGEFDLLFVSYIAIKALLLHSAVARLSHHFSLY